MQHGRQLAQMSKPNGSGTENINFTYDAKKRRIAKERETTGSVDGDSYRYAFTAEYTYLDDALTDMKWIEIDGSDSSFHFTYDATGPMSMTFYGAEYFYLKNAQGGLAGLIDQQGRRLYPIPLLICIDGAEYSFGFSCYKKLPSDFSSTAHLIRIRVCIGYDWRFWDKTPEIAELKSDGELCFSLRDSSRERMTNKTIFVSGGVVFTGFFIHGAVCDVCVSPVKKKRRMKERLRREAKRDL